jgi:hypothetical protein
MSKKRELMAFTFPFILFALLNVIEHKKQTVSCVISSLPEKSNFKGVEIYQNLYLSHHESLDTFQAKETENNWRKLYQVK